MKRQIEGLHHVTALARDPQVNVDFYTGVLGLRLVKKTVNYDDPGTYHLYYGDERGRPGTVMTFFAWPQARRGEQGAGQATVTSFSVPEGAIGAWQERLGRFGVAFDEPRRRFDEEVLTLLDPDGLRLELVTAPGAAERPVWEGGPVPAASAIRGFDGVTLTEWNAEKTAELLTGVIGFRQTGESGNRVRFEAAAGGAGTRVDVLVDPLAPRGRVAVGTVHHVAFRVAQDAEQAEWHRELSDLGLHVSAILDRQYFHSIYFREPGGVLFEIATDLPGFTTDESVEELGSGLKLPSWLESARGEIESVLPPVAPRPVAPAVPGAPAAPSVSTAGGAP